MNTNYNLLHIHSTFSAGDSILKIPEYVEKCKQLGISAASLTEHGNLCSAYSFFKECQKADIKAIVGTEMYISEVGKTTEEIRTYVKNKKETQSTDLEERDEAEKQNLRSHIILYAKNHKGYNNLVKLNNESFCNRFYRKPLTLHKLIFENYEGLIVTTACIASAFAQSCKKNDKKQFDTLLQQYKDVFKDNFYLEIQLNDIEELYKYNDWLFSASKQFGIKPVFGLDAHYINKEDNLARDIYIAIIRKKNLNDPKFQSSICNLHIKTIDEIIKYNKEKKIVNDNLLVEALENTYELAAKCNFSFVFDGYKFPQLDAVKIQHKLITAAANKLNLLNLDEKNKKLYIGRLKYELKVLKTHNTFSYFYVLREALQYVKDKGGLIGFGRGSAAGSLFCYLIGITNVDPIIHELSFERFISKDRGQIKMKLEIE